MEQPSCDTMPKIYEDAEYWQDKAESTYSQAAAVQDVPVFYDILISHARQYEFLARTAIKMNQARAARARILPQYRESAVCEKVKK